MSSESGPRPAAGEDPETLRARYSRLGTRGVTVSSDPRAEVVFSSSRLEGWVVASGLLLASCLAMGIYLVVLHH